MVETIHPCIRLVDDSRSRGSQLRSGEVERGDIVGVMLKSTSYTSEKRLSSSLGSIDMSTSLTYLRGILRINIDY